MSFSFSSSNATGSSVLYAWEISHLQSAMLQINIIFRWSFFFVFYTHSSIDFFTQFSYSEPFIYYYTLVHKHTYTHTSQIYKKKPNSISSEQYRIDDTSIFVVIVVTRYWIDKFQKIILHISFSIYSYV